MTKSNIGTTGAMPAVELNPSRPLPMPCWKTSTNTPYAAATDSRLSATALIATTIDRHQDEREHQDEADHEWQLRLQFIQRVVPLGGNACHASLCAGKCADGLGNDPVSQYADCGIRRRVGTGALDGDGDVGDGRVAVDRDSDRPFDPSSGQRSSLELRDRVLNGRCLHIGRLDDDACRQRVSGERLLHAVIRLDDGE
jgi:hypothetical protein